MKTRMAEILGIEYPTMQGGMQYLGVPELASAVSEAGGLGTINVTTYPDPKGLCRAIRKVKEMTGCPFAVNISLIPSLRPGKEFFDQVNVILEEGVPAVETAGASLQELANILNVYKDQVKWIHRAACVKHAKKAESMGADPITMIGFEVVGRPHTDGVGTMVLVNRIAREAEILVLAAGGIVDGRSLLAVLSLGYGGIAMGTRFVASKECLIHQNQKEWIANSDENRMILCQKSIWNMVRVADSEVARKCPELEFGGASPEELMPMISGKRGKTAYESDDVDEGMFAVGPSCGLIHEVKTCGEVLDSIMEETGQCLDRLNAIQENRQQTPKDITREEGIMSKKVLEGIRVLDSTTMAAGPTAGATMADYGAEAIKIERLVRGEDGRKFPPMADGESLPYCWFDRGKKPLAVDPTDPEGSEVAKKPLPIANVILENSRPGIMKKYGLDYESVQVVKKDIAYVSLATFGQTGKYVPKLGYDITAQAMSSIMSVTGEVNGAPQRSGFPLGDLLGGPNMFTGAMTMLYHWCDTGEGQYVDILLLRTLIYINTPLIHCNLGPEQMSRRQGNHRPTTCPYGVFHCGDRDIVMVAAGKRIRESLCDLAGRPEWKEDPEYAEVSDRARNQMMLVPLISKWPTDAYGGRDEALKALDVAGVPCCRVYNEYQVWSDKGFRLNGWLQEQPTMSGMDPKPSFITRTGNCGMSETPAGFRRAPLLGEQNEEILRELGYSSEKIAQLGQWRPYWSLDRHGKGGL